MGVSLPRTLLLGGAVLALSVPAAAFAQGGSDQARGQDILQAVQQGQKSCAELTANDYELAGEAWMGQALGSARAHEAMNNLMSSMMGSAGEEQMHEYMGRRATGCGGGSVPTGYGRMMSMMGLMGGAPGAAGMMGGPGTSTNGNYYGPGSMMGGSSSSSDNNDDGPSAAAMVGMMAVLIGAVALLLVIFRPWRHSSRNSRELLDRRLATGELSPAEYRRAKDLLEGGSK